MAELTIGTIITAVLSGASLAMSAFTLLSSKPGNLNQQDPGVAVQRKGSDTPKIIAWGDTRIPSVRVYTNVNNNNSEMLAQVYSLGWGPLKSVEEIYIDGVPYFKTSGDRSNVWSNQGAEFPNVQMGIRRGLAVESVWSQITSNSDGELSNNHRGDRTGSVSLLARRQVNMSGDNNVRFISPQVRIEALVHGNAVVDPRYDPLLLGATDITKRKWVDGSVISYRNPALCLLTYCLDPDFGVGLTADSIDINSFLLAANYCDQYGLKCDGFSNADDDHGTTIKDLASSFSSMVFIQDGLLTVRPNTKRPVKYTIREGDLVRDNAISVSNNNQSEYANAVVCEFQNKTTEYNKDKYALPANKWTDEAIISDGGNVKEFSLKLPYTTDPMHVKRFANEALKIRKYSKKSAKITIDNNDFDLRIGDVIRLVHVPLTVDALFTVDEIGNSLNEKVMESSISLSEYRDEFFDTNYQDGIISGSQGNPNIIVLPVSGLNFIQNNTLTTGSGELHWNNQYKGDCSFRIEYRRTGTITWSYYNEVRTESCVMTNLQSGANYDFRVLVVTAYKTSSWATLNNVRINRSVSLPAVTGLNGNFVSRDAVFVWNPIKGAILNNSPVGDGVTDLSQLVSHYEISVKHGTVAKKTYRSSSPRFIYSYEENASNGLSRDLTVTVKGVSIYGDSSPDTVMTVRNEPMSAPSGVSAKAQLINLTVEWLNPSDLVSDYSATDIWITDSKTTAPTSLDLVASSSVGFFTALQDAKKSGWIWLAHRDVFGHESIPVYSAPVFFRQTTIDEELSGSGFEDTIESIQNNIDVIEGALDTVNTEIGVIEGTITSNKTEIDTKLAQQQATITAEKTRLDGQVAELNTAKNSIASQGQSILKNATDIKSNKTSITSQGARLTTVEQVATDNTGSIATTNQLLETINGDLSSKIETNKQSIVTTNSALSTLDQRLTAKTNTNAADILSNKTAIATTNSSMASMDTRLTAKTNTNAADILTNKTAITTTNSSMASMNTSLQAQIDTNKAGVSTNKTAIAATDKNLADYKISVSTSFGATNGRIDTVSSSVSTLQNTVTTNATSITANYNDLNGKISTNSTAIVNANKAITSLDTKLTASINGVDGKADAIRADVTSQGLAIVDLNSSLASMDTRLTASIGGVDGKVTGIESTVTSQGLAIVNLDQSLTSFKTSTAANFGTANSRIDTTNTNLATTNKALSDYKISTDSRIGQNTANITSQGSTLVTLDQSLSSYKTSNNAEVAGIKSSVTTVQQSIATTDGKVSSMYGLRVDANGKVAGMTLNASNNSTSIDFLADTLRIASSTTGTPVTAFEVRGGQVMMRNALIGSLTASQIAADQINGNHIAATSIIQAGSGATSATLNGADANWRIYAGSTTPGSAPFRVSTTGGLVATNATITGTINATSGTFNGTVNATGGNFTGYVQVGNSYMSANPAHDFLNGNGGNFRVDRNGSLYANNGTFGGTIYADKIVGDIVNAGVTDLPAFNVFSIQSGQVYDLFTMNVPAASFVRIANLVKFPVNWRGAENGGTYSMYLRDSTGRNSWLFSGSGQNTFDISSILENLYVRVPANCTWWKIVLTADRRSSLTRTAADQTGWTLFKEGSGGVSVSHP
ncbi:DUF1983 domain-containing protein [Aeromonas rivipollensis]|uniref:DUF1983 domain-containing protein n=1 Tax=Aeromonas rivipollensis TaxID=948519 RepID=A0ABX0CYB0_9GAMM|nr:phage tail protein [Aeromonas rivipollensis]NEX88902.1 DUF1983 domain-containing protein [Aeromonas rivipollensis]NEY04641.1 DUF1983 domain-containing protein [Aeromonas rivipollensis]